MKSHEEIRKSVDDLNDIIAIHFMPGTFTLNAMAVDAMNKIFELQNECQHEFHDGKCIWCDKEEK